jgi:hypothetical protein
MLALGACSSTPAADSGTPDVPVTEDRPDVADVTPPVDSGVPVDVSVDVPAADLPADVPVDLPGDIPADRPGDAPADVPVDTAADVRADAPPDTPADAPPATCVAAGGTCTMWRWNLCPVGTEPIDPDPHRDCGGGWCCVAAPASSCSMHEGSNCVAGATCTGCWHAEGTGLTCETGRVCCVDICD